MQADQMLAAIIVAQECSLNPQVAMDAKDIYIPANDMHGCGNKAESMHQNLLPDK